MDHKAGQIHLSYTKSMTLKYMPLNNHLTFSCNDLVVVDHYRPLLQRYCLDSLDSLFKNEVGTLLSQPGISQWRERIRLVLNDKEGNPKTFYLKRFRNPPHKEYREVGNARGARSVAAVEWTWLWTLHQLKIPVAQPIAFGQEFEHGKEKRSAILIEEVPGNSLEFWFDQWGKTDRQKIVKLIEPVADLVAGLHRNGFFHRDLYLCHIFYDPESPLEHALHLIDLQRVIKPIWRRKRWVIKDLASLNYSVPLQSLSTKDRIRWLKRYLEVTTLSPKDKRLLYRIIKKTQRIAKHDSNRHIRLYGTETRNKMEYTL